MSKGTLKVASVDGAYTPRELKTFPTTGELGVVDEVNNIIKFARQDMINVSNEVVISKVQEPLNAINQQISDIENDIATLNLTTEKVANKVKASDAVKTDDSYYNALMVDDLVANKKSKLKGVLGPVLWELHPTTEAINVLEPIHFMLDDFSKHTLPAGTHYPNPVVSNFDEVIYLYARYNVDNDSVTLTGSNQLLDYRTPNYVLLGSLFKLYNGGIGYNFQAGSLVAHPYVINNSLFLRESKELRLTGGTITLNEANNTISIAASTMLKEGLGINTSPEYPNTKTFTFANPTVFVETYPDYPVTKTTTLKNKYYNNTSEELVTVPTELPWTVTVPYLVPNGQVLMWLPQGSLATDCCFPNANAAVNALYSLPYDKSNLSDRGVFFGYSIIRNTVTGEAFVHSALPAVLGGSFTGNSSGIPEQSGSVKVNGTSVKGINFNQGVNYVGDTAIVSSELPLLTPLMFTRKLTGSDAVGWLEQGSEITRATYPTLYDMLYNEYKNNSTLTMYTIDDIKAMLSERFNYTGSALSSVVVTQLPGGGYVSQFTKALVTSLATNYRNDALGYYYADAPSESNRRLAFRFQTGSDVTTKQIIFTIENYVIQIELIGGYIKLSSGNNGTSWNLNNAINIALATPNTSYWVSITNGDSNGEGNLYVRVVQSGALNYDKVSQFDVLGTVRGLAAGASNGGGRGVFGGFSNGTSLFKGKLFTPTISTYSKDGKPAGRNWNGKFEKLTYRGKSTDLLFADRSGHFTWNDTPLNCGIRPWITADGVMSQGSGRFILPLNLRGFTMTHSQSSTNLVGDVEMDSLQDFQLHTGITTKINNDVNHLSTLPYGYDTYPSLPNSVVNAFTFASAVAVDSTTRQAYTEAARNNARASAETRSRTQKAYLYYKVGATIQDPQVIDANGALLAISDLQSEMSSKADVNGNNLASTNVIAFNKRLSTNPIYVSPEFYFNALNVPVEFDAGLGDLTDIERMCLKTALVAICKTANNGYEVGDVIFGPTIGHLSNWSIHAYVVVTKTGKIWTQIGQSTDINLFAKNGVGLRISATAASNFWAFRMLVY